MFISDDLMSVAAALMQRVVWWIVTGYPCTKVQAK